MAGGLNLYGFGGGDPVNYTDPYGLAACPMAPEDSPRYSGSFLDCTPEEMARAEGVQEPFFADPLNLLPAGRILKGLGWARNVVGNGISRLLGRGASGSGGHLVLGLANHGIERTAAAVGGQPEPVWLGSLMSHKRDASGQLYMRNRYFDPASGRFTQEDRSAWPAA